MNKLESLEELPFITILMAAFNEEKVIQQKLISIINTTYPIDKWECIIGSDGSTDATDSIIQSFVNENKTIRLIQFGGRFGKSAIINSIKKEAKGSILILTDANIYFSNDLLYQLQIPFSNSKVGLVGANIINTGMRKDGISLQEETYIKSENQIKYYEGEIWGTMMGAFGACYAIRSELMPEIPKNFLMEDFYITMKVILSNQKAINNLNAIAYEDVSNIVHEEFKRKIRISAGNYQNLQVFKKVLLKPFSSFGFCFISHKFLRWMGPFLIIILFISTLVQLKSGIFFQIFASLLICSFCTIPADILFKKLNIHIFAVRIVSYFYLMNLALLIGFIKYVKGIKTSVWVPTKRNIEIQ